MILHLAMFFSSVISVADAPNCVTAEGKTEQKSMQPAFYVVGTRVRDVGALGGFASSSNDPQPIPKHILNDESATPNALSVIVRDGITNNGDDEQEGQRQVFIVNRTTQRVTFPAQDSAIALHQEALDKFGTWRPIEYRPSSWCGNSYHNVFLGAKECWQLTANVYTGPFKTKLRYALRIAEGQYIYSNEYDGSVNEYQFEKPEPE